VSRFLTAATRDALTASLWKEAREGRVSRWARAEDEGRRVPQPLAAAGLVLVVVRDGPADAGVQAVIAFARHRSGRGTRLRRALIGLELFIAASAVAGAT
jgi:hypothetical protein